MNDSILFLHERDSLRNRDARHRARHIERGTLVESRHELASEPEVKRDGRGKKDKIQSDHQLPMAKTPAQDRQIDGLSNPGGGVGRFRTKLAAQGYSGHLS